MGNSASELWLLAWRGPPPSGAILFPRRDAPPSETVILHPQEPSSILRRDAPPKQWSPTLRSHPLSREEVLHSLKQWSSTVRSHSLSRGEVLHPLKQWSSTFRSFSAEPLERRFILTVFLMFDWFTQSKHERQFYGSCCQRDWGVSSQSMDQVSCGGICIENIV